MAIQKIKLHNFKKFETLEINCNEELNVLIGDNEAGKSTILQAIDLVLSGSRNKVESIGLSSLFSKQTIKDFFTDKQYENLPKLFIEIYLTEQNNEFLNGKNNSETRICDGLKLVFEPDDEASKDIKEILSQSDDNFPFEYYTIKFYTFAEQPYSGYKKYVQHLFIDSSQINNEYATREYIKSLYNSLLDGKEKNKHFNEYRRSKDDYVEKVLKDVNDKLESEKFVVQTNSKSNLEADLNISDNDGITIDNKGKGQQCFIKTKFALEVKAGLRELDVILLEEPENHLSHLNMKKLIKMIQTTHNKQIFITTHNSLISSRLDLKTSILLNSNSNQIMRLNNLENDTAKFFMKAPDNNILEYVLSKKVILVEGDAEYILMEALYKNVTKEELVDSDIHIISVGGTSFKRYLDISKILQIKTAVIRDNDGDYEQNITDRYNDYDGVYIKVFADSDNSRSTFEICIYQDNKALCDELFTTPKRTLTIQEYMLKNKADVAFELLDKKANEISVPTYIQKAIEWIKE
ncbi:MAG: AAA family ATPase [Arcobacteraceae bacterium]|nr:AAA family ATPase [Arcobacteraceae bacterium]